jgi:hypothetical protein
MRRQVFHLCQKWRLSSSVVCEKRSAGVKAAANLAGGIHFQGACQELQSNRFLLILLVTITRRNVLYSLAARIPYKTSGRTRTRRCFPFTCNCLAGNVFSAFFVSRVFLTAPVAFALMLLLLSMSFCYMSCLLSSASLRPRVAAMAIAPLRILLTHNDESYDGCSLPDSTHWRSSLAGRKAPWLQASRRLRRVLGRGPRRPDRYKA